MWPPHQSIEQRSQIVVRADNGLFNGWTSNQSTASTDKWVFYFTRFYHDQGKFDKGTASLAVLDGVNFGLKTVACTIATKANGSYFLSLNFLSDSHLTKNEVTKNEKTQGGRSGSFATAFQMHTLMV